MQRRGGSLTLHHVGPTHGLERLLCAFGIDGAAGLAQDVRDFRQLGRPLFFRDPRRADLTEFLTQQDHSQQVPEDQPFLLRQIAGGNVLLKIAVEPQDVADNPDRSRAQVDDRRELGIEQTSQFVGQWNGKLANWPAERIGLGLDRGWIEFSLRDDPSCKQFGIESQSSQRSGREFIRPRCAHLGEDRAGNFEYAFECLNPFGTIGEPQVIEQKRPVHRIASAKDEQL